MSTHRPRYHRGMRPRPRLSNARSELCLPSWSLSGCVRGVMLRDTRGVALSPEQRFSHYPATPLCSLSWYLDGQIDMLEAGHAATPDAPRRRMPARWVFSGPQTQPVVTWSHGPAHGLMLLLLPDAFQSLTGLDPGAWRNQTVDAKRVLPPDWWAMGEQVSKASDDATRTELIEAFFAPRWQACRPTPVLSAQRYADWLQGLTLRAATTRAGRSLRQMERRVLQWAGLPVRELRGFVRAERVFFELMAQANAMPMDWAGLALDHQFSDQSHLCRTSRRMTGCSPTELRDRIAHDEGFWPYRIWQ